MSHFTTPFGFSSTALDVLANVDLHGKRVIVTGGAAGIGLETTRALALAGASVTIAARRVSAAERVVGELRSATGNTSIEARYLDLSDLRSVNTFATSWVGPLDILETMLAS